MTSVCTCATILLKPKETPIERGKKQMRMERLAVTMPHSTAKAFRRCAQLHDVDLYMVAKTAVMEFCKSTPPMQELMGPTDGEERVFISMPDIAMRLLELWSANTGISKAKLMEWAIRKLAEKLDDKSEEEKE